MAGAFKFGGDLAQSCSNAVHAAAQEALMASLFVIYADGGQLMQGSSLYEPLAIYRSYSGRPFRRYIVCRRGLARSTAPNQRS